MIDLATALVKAQSEIPPVHKNATAKVKTKTGADYSYTYVTLDALLAVVLPALNKNGIALIQAPTLSDMGAMVLKTVLAHGPSGETFEAQAPLKASGTPQDLGSEISYARRYAIMSLLGIAADEDDDGAAASKPKRIPAAESPVAKTDNELATASTNKRLWAIIGKLADQRGVDDDQVSFALKTALHVSSLSNLSKENADKALVILESWQKKVGAAA